MVKRFHTTDSDNGFRLDQYLQQRIPELSRTKIRKIVDLGGVHIDGRRVRKCGKTLKPHETIELHSDSSPLDPYRLKPSDILFQDKYIIVINKPAGIETQPTPARYKGTLYEALQVWLKRDRRFRKLQIGMAQRLDRDTSGVIIFSIHPESHKSLTEQIGNHTVKKEYLAVIQGVPTPSQGTYHSFLRRDRNTHRMQSVTNGGKEAITHYQILKDWSHSSLVSVELVTGRTHQIRAHFAEAGHPLLGDQTYGGPKIHGGCSWTRQCLHSWKLQLTHPKTGERLSFSAPVPSDMGNTQ